MTTAEYRYGYTIERRFGPGRKRVETLAMRTYTTSTLRDHMLEEETKKLSERYPDDHIHCDPWDDHAHREETDLWNG